VLLHDQQMLTGTVEVVGGDYLEIAEHDRGEARRRAAVRRHRLIPLAAVAVVSLPPGSPRG
jgi:hypothetical protein